MKALLRPKQKWVLAGSLTALAGTALLLTAGQPAGKYTAHEWGTFTSFQGGDGELVAWRPLKTSLLPAFVYNWYSPGSDNSNRFYLGKGEALTLQRMETPVIYFYSDKEQTVDVSVKFPQGVVTEWYPRALLTGPFFAPPPSLSAPAEKVVQKNSDQPAFTLTSVVQQTPAEPSRIHWETVKLLPIKQHSNLIGSLLKDPTGNHYLAARDTEAAFVSVKSGVATNPAPELEKFLFYRGIGNFSTPLVVTVGHQISNAAAPNNEQRTPITLANTGKEPLKHLYVLSVKDHQSKFVYVDKLGAGEAKSVSFDRAQEIAPVETTAKIIAEQMKHSLVRSGLFPQEAAAMVKTWDSSWFVEEGVRVLYVLPREWTDRTLPLSLDPAPRELVRVMVGRAEVFMPASDQTLTSAIRKASEGDAEARAVVVDELKHFGRFAEPALRLTLKNASPKISDTGWKLFNEATRPATTASLNLE